MKLSSIAMFVIVAGLIISAYALFFSEINVQYPDTNLNETSLVGYDYIEEINSTVEPIKEELNKLGEEQGWLSFIAQGVTSIPKVMITAVQLSWQSLSYGISILIKGSNNLNLSPVIISGLIAIISVFAVHRLIEYWRYREPL